MRGKNGTYSNRSIDRVSPINIYGVLTTFWSHLPTYQYRYRTPYRNAQ